MKGKGYIPGTIYLNGKRYWWKVRLPGQKKTRAIPLRPEGARFATADRRTAEKVARGLWEKAVYKSEQVGGKVNNIGDLARGYMAWAREYYQKSREADNIQYAVRALLLKFAGLAPEDFGPLKLKEVREAMIESGLTRGVINKRIGMIKRAFAWGVENEMVPVSVHQALMTVKNLQKGRSRAKETEPVKPIHKKHVRAIYPYTSKQIADMLELQILTGMRSAEVCAMRPADIDCEGEIWLYRPESHKGDHLGREKIVCLGPKAQEIVKPYLKRKVDSYIFSPLELAGRRANRGVRDRYDKDSYRKAINHGIAAAQKAEDKAAAAEGREPRTIQKFHPHQIRHTVATELQKQMGPEAARVVLGHSDLNTTQIYAEIDKSLAIEAARKYG